MLIQNIKAYLKSSVISQVLQAVQQFVIRTLLPPTVLGIWNYVGVIQSFVNTFEPGTLSAAGREIPLQIGKGDSEKVEQLRKTTLTARVCFAVASIVGIAIYFGLNYAQVHALWMSYLTAMAILTITAFTECYTVFFQTTQNYTLLSRVQIQNAVFNFICIPIGVWVAGIKGLLIAVIFTQSVNAITQIRVAKQHRIGLAKKATINEFWSLLKFGLPLKIIDYPASFIGVADSMIVASYLGLAPLALYSTAKILLTLLIDIPSRVGNVILSRTYHLFGQNGNFNQIKKELFLYLIGLYLGVLPLLTFIFKAGFSAVIFLFLPKYQGALAIFTPLFAMLFFAPQVNLLHDLLYVQRKLKTVAVVNLSGLIAFGLGIASLILTQNWQLSTIALSVTGAYMVMHGTALFAFGKQNWGGKKSAILFLVSVATSAYTALVTHSCTVVSAHISQLSKIGQIVMLAQSWGKSILCLIPITLIGAIILYPKIKNKIA